MANGVLVAYATKYGATEEIAERIGSVLRDAGLEVDVADAGNAGDPGCYCGVVLGSAVYIGRWRKAATRFLTAHEVVLSQKPVWLFSSGPTGVGDPVELTQGWRFPGKLQPIANRISPRDIALFHGDAQIDKLNVIERWLLKNVKAPVGDFRDWDAIETWARGIATVLKPAVSGPSQSAK